MKRKYIKRIIREVRLHKGTQMLYISIPNNKGIKLGDFVEVKKV